MRAGDETTRLIARIQAGDVDAFNRLVRRYQDMAVGYAASLLGDFHLAQDAAQEAFVEAYRDLPALRAPEAFASWLRRIVFKRCDRITRGKRLPLAPLEDVSVTVAASVTDPAEVVIRRERQEAVRRAIGALPSEQRIVTTLFYIGDYSQREIAAFLEIPVTTVKSRLHVARGRLQERMICMAHDDLHERRPSQDEEFLARVNEQITSALAAIAAGDLNEREIRGLHPAARYRDPHPIFRLTTTLLGWALTRRASEIRVVPESAAVTVWFTVRGAEEEAITLPKSLQEPMTARLKDGAGLDAAAQNIPQRGHFPVHNSRDDTDYNLSVSCAPTDLGEMVVLRFTPT